MVIDGSLVGSPSLTSRLRSSRVIFFVKKSTMLSSTCFWAFSQRYGQIQKEKAAVNRAEREGSKFIVSIVAAPFLDEEGQC